MVYRDYKVVGFVGFRVEAVEGTMSLSGLGGRTRSGFCG